MRRERGIIIADTKFEWGRVDGELILIDEVLTPDSSRFWPADQYEPGHGQPSFDKQFVRDWLSDTDWDKNSEPPALPDEIVAQTREKYIEAYEQLTGQAFAWNKMLGAARSSGRDGAAATCAGAVIASSSSSLTMAGPDFLFQPAGADQVTVSLR